MTNIFKEIIISISFFGNERKNFWNQYRDFLINYKFQSLRVCLISFLSLVYRNYLLLGPSPTTKSKSLSKNVRFGAIIGRGNNVRATEFGATNEFGGAAAC